MFKKIQEMVLSTKINPGEILKKLGIRAKVFIIYWSLFVEQSKRKSEKI